MLSIYRRILDPRSSEGIFVGYDISSPAYLVYHPKSNSVKRHRVVKFTERFGKAPAKQIPVIPVFDELDEDAAVHEDVVDLTDNKNDVLEKFPSQRKFDVLGKFPSQRNQIIIIMN